MNQQLASKRTDYNEESAVLKIRRSMPVNEVNWTRVREILIGNLKVDEKNARFSVSRLRKRVKDIFDFGWFMHPILTPQEEMVVRALCDSEGADIIELSGASGSLLNLLMWDKSVVFQPTLSRMAPLHGSIAHPFVDIRFGRYRYKVRTARESLFLAGLLILASVILYVLVVTLLIYGVAVFVVSFTRPSALAGEALRNPTLLLAVFGVLTSIAGLSRQWLLFRRPKSRKNDFTG